MQVLSIISPPYSQEFTTAFLPLLQNEITDTLISNNKDDLVSLFLGKNLIRIHLLFHVVIETSPLLSTSQPNSS